MQCWEGAAEGARRNLTIGKSVSNSWKQKLVLR